MPDLMLTINGQRLIVPEGTMVAAALARAGVTTVRRSVSGEPRGPVCGMGVCGECRVTVDGTPEQLSCQIPCTEGMEVTTDALV